MYPALLMQERRASRKPPDPPRPKLQQRFWRRSRASWASLHQSKRLRPPRTAPERISSRVDGAVPRPSAPLPSTSSLAAEECDRPLAAHCRPTRSHHDADRRREQARILDRSAESCPRSLRGPRPARGELNRQGPACKAARSPLQLQPRRRAGSCRQPRPLQLRTCLSVASCRPIDQPCRAPPTPSSTRSLPLLPSSTRPLTRMTKTAGRAGRTRRLRRSSRGSYDHEGCRTRPSGLLLSRMQVTRGRTLITAS